MSLSRQAEGYPQKMINFSKKGPFQKERIENHLPVPAVFRGYVFGGGVFFANYPMSLLGVEEKRESEFEDLKLI